MHKNRRPKLGQHFLSDARYCSRVAEAIDLDADDLVIEIGPGQGAITGLLARRARSVVAIEVDCDLVNQLRQKFLEVPSVEIVHSDVLQVDLGEICRKRNIDRCSVFGNLPYYITSPIIHHLLASARYVRAMALLVQREVANRLVACPGTRDYGYLTVFTSLYSTAHKVLQIPPGAFSPPPKVHSTLVRFEIRSDAQSVTAEDEAFVRFLKQSFALKRKMLVNCLSPHYARQAVEEELRRLGLPRTVRAEQLSVEQLVAVFSSLD